MENRNGFGDLNSNVGVSKTMAFLIDLNETPIVSPRERDGTISICSVCGREVVAGRSGATKEEQWEWKCFRCLLQNDGASSSGGAGAGFDINASPPREAEKVYPADHLSGGRNSGTNQEKRRAWRAFVKAAKTIYEMVEALMVLEDAIKSEYLHTEWWYWSSPSTAAKMTTLSALSLAYLLTGLSHLV